MKQQEQLQNTTTTAFYLNLKSPPRTTHLVPQNSLLHYPSIVVQFNARVTSASHGLRFCPDGFWIQMS